MIGQRNRATPHPTHKHLAQLRIAPVVPGISGIRGWNERIEVALLMTAYASNVSAALRTRSTGKLY